jgi:hypothetical protein
LIVDPGTVTLNGITNNSTGANSAYQVSNGNKTILIGTITNNGVMNVLAGGAMNISGPVTLAGTGGVTVSNGGTIADDAGGNAQLTIANGQSVFGDGAIGNGHLTLVNNGTIESDSGGGTLTINTPGGFTNNGALTAAFNSFLAVTGSDVTAAGTTSIGAGSALSVTNGHNYVQSDGSTLVDGILQASAVQLNGGTITGTGTIQAR